MPKTKAPKPRSWWVTRDPFSSCLDIWADQTRPTTLYDGRFINATGSRVVACEDFFYLATGIKVERGQCLRVQFSATVVKED